MKKLCAWCSIILSEGDNSRVSHGICKACLAIEKKKFELYKKENCRHLNIDIIDAPSFDGGLLYKKCIDCNSFLPLDYGLGGTL
jgi:hypothetical protein